MEPVVYLVTDGWTDRYGVFSTRERAQAWIDRQKERKYPFVACLTIEEIPLDVAEDLH